MSYRWTIPPFAPVSERFPKRWGRSWGRFPMRAPQNASPTIALIPWGYSALVILALNPRKLARFNAAILLGFRRLAKAAVAANRTRLIRDHNFHTPLTLPFRSFY